MLRRLLDAELGRYLQWVGYDFTSFTVISSDSSLKQASKKQHVQVIIESGGVSSKSGVQCLVSLIFD